MSEGSTIYQIAVPSPLYGHFDYLPPSDHGARLCPGVRVRVPFGRSRELTGIILGAKGQSDIPPERLRRIGQVLDSEPLLPAPLLSLLAWVADYYHHPIGEVLAAALPAWLRQGRPARIAGEPYWVLTARAAGFDAAGLGRAPAQARVFAALADAPGGLEAVALAQVSPRWRAAVTALARRGLVERQARDCLSTTAPATAPGAPLNPAQQAAVAAITASLGTYQAHLLHGVTGSGKTEVYLAAIQQVLARDEQALVLVPEIGLTPQFVARFERALGMRCALLHSGLADTERACAWLAAGEGRAQVVLGTRSAVFTPLPRLGLIVIDEEHDASYKQQDGLRYSARDVAVMRGARAGVPVVLGSATPSLETLRNAREGAYRRLELPDRTGGAGMPDVELLDLRRLAADRGGLTHPLREAIAARLARGEQSLLFLNRRGFAPVWMCRACGWIAACERCDARLTHHQRAHKLICHHCAHEEPVREHCPKCGALPAPVGSGTERIEQMLAAQFPQARIVRLDRDATRARGALEEQLRRIHAGEADILVGTQMLSKGHDFPNVTLVGVLNADQGLYSADFRAPERLFQQILQVAGRAGRAEKPGKVLIQTVHPDHPLFTALARHDFDGFADFLLAERREAEQPPFSFFALLRAESPAPAAALGFLRAAHALAGQPEGVAVHEPLSAPMEKRAGRHRAQLLVQAPTRKPLHQFLQRWVGQLSGLKEGRRVRWSLDVDPGDLY